MRTYCRQPRRVPVPAKVYTSVEAEVMIKFLNEPTLKMVDLAVGYGFSTTKVTRLTNAIVAMSNKDREAFLKKYNKKLA